MLVPAKPLGALRMYPVVVNCRGPIFTSLFSTSSISLSSDSLEEMLSYNSSISLSSDSLDCRFGCPLLSLHPFRE